MPNDKNRKQRGGLGDDGGRRGTRGDDGGGTGDGRGAHCNNIWQTRPGSGCPIRGKSGALMSLITL